MVICSPSVKDVLDRLFLNATTMGRTPVEYNNCIQALHRIETGILRTMAKQPLSWARGHLFVVKTSRYWFGYVIINDIPIVEEVFDSRTNTILTEMFDKNIIVTESDIKWMVKECIKKLLNESKKKVGINGYYIAKKGCDYIYNGEKYHSVISVVHKGEKQKYHIGEDDHCYVFYVELDGKTEQYENPYIFDELLDAIKMLPTPS